MTVSEHYAAMLADAKKTPEYWAEVWALEITNAVVSEMERAGVSQQELSTRLQAKPSFVSRMLNAPHNMTLTTAARLMTAVGLGAKFVPCSIGATKTTGAPADGSNVHSFTTRRRQLQPVASPIVEYQKTYAAETSANEAHILPLIRVANGA